MCGRRRDRAAGRRTAARSASARTGKIAHHSARSLVFPLPAPGAVAKKAPLPWDPSSPEHGLGWRAIALDRSAPRITEIAFR